MDNNDIFKKLRVALQLRDDQIIDIMQLVDFRISKAELSAFFRNQDHPNYMECGDQVLRNFLNGLVIHLRDTKENPKNPAEVIARHSKKDSQKEPASSRVNSAKSKAPKPKSAGSKPFQKQHGKKDSPKIEIVEKVRYNNGKKS